MYEDSAPLPLCPITPTTAARPKALMPTAAYVRHGRGRFRLNDCSIPLV